MGGLTSHLPSSLLLARSPRATSLRLCVGPAVQVSQALPRGGAESDFSALFFFIYIRRVYRLIFFILSFKVISFSYVKVEVEFILEVGTNLSL